MMTGIVAAIVAPSGAGKSHFVKSKPQRLQGLKLVDLDWVPQVHQVYVDTAHKYEPKGEPGHWWDDDHPNRKEAMRFKDAELTKAVRAFHADSIRRGEAVVVFTAEKPAVSGFDQWTVVPPLAQYSANLEKRRKEKPQSFFLEGDERRQKELSGYRASASKNRIFESFDDALRDVLTHWTSLVSDNRREEE